MILLYMAPAERLFPIIANKRNQMPDVTAGIGLESFNETNGTSGASFLYPRDFTGIYDLVLIAAAKTNATTVEKVIKSLNEGHAVMMAKSEIPVKVKSRK